MMQEGFLIQLKTQIIHKKQPICIYNKRSSVG